MGESRRPCERNHCVGLPCVLDPLGGPCASVAATRAPTLGVVPAPISFPLNFGKAAGHPVDYPKTGFAEIGAQAAFRNTTFPPTRLRAHVGLEEMWCYGTLLAL